MTTQPFLASLACMATGIAFFLGFMPASKVPFRFFALHSMIAGIVWLLVFIQSQNIIFLLCATACGLAWHNFRMNNIPTGKMLLALGSGLAVGFALFKSGAILPPSSIPLSWYYFWVISILFSAAVLGSCYLALFAGYDYVRKGPIEKDVFQRCLNIFLVSLALRAVLFLAVAVFIGMDDQNPALKAQWLNYTQEGWIVVMRALLGLILPAWIVLWGLSQLKPSRGSFKFAPFYAIVFMIIWGEMFALRIGF